MANLKANTGAPFGDQVLKQMRHPLSIKGLFTSFLAGLLASLALPPHGLTIFVMALSWSGLQILHVQDWRHGFWIGLATGFGWFIYSLYWISNALVTSGGTDLLLLPFSALGLPLFMALFWAVGFGLAVRLSSWSLLGRPQIRLIFVIICLAVMEYARGHVLTGFPWNQPGLVLANSDLTLALASIIGMSGGIVLILMLAMLPALLMLNARVISAGIILLISMLMGFSFAHLGQKQDLDHVMQVRIVQPNIDQQDKWDRELRKDHLNKLIKYSRAPMPKPLDAIIWPETAFAGVYERERGVVNAIVSAASSGTTPVVVGTLSQEGPQQFFNSAGLYTPDKGFDAFYHKRHLVPFGEYVPLRDLIPFIDGIAGPFDFSEGQAITPLNLTKQDGQKITILPLICYEVIFPMQVREDQHKINADVIVNLTNDAWFGNTNGPRQHLAMAQLRSAELGLPMIRVANTGISAVINSYGHVTTSIDYGQEGYRDAGLTERITTIYSKSGDWAYIMLVMVLIVVAAVMSSLTPLRDQE